MFLLQALLRPPAHGGGRAAAKAASPSVVRLLIAAGSVAVCSIGVRAGEAQVTVPTAGPDSVVRVGDVRVLSMPAALRVENVSLGRALAELEARAGVQLVYSPVLVPMERLVTCRCEGATVAEAAQTILQGTGFEVVVIGDHLVVRRAGSNAWPTAGAPDGHGVQSSPPIAPQPDPTAAAPVAGDRRTGILTGRVVDARTGQPVGSAQVLIPRIGGAGLSRSDGGFTLLDMPEGTHTVTVRRIGYRDRSRQVTVAAGASVSADFQLVEDALALDAVFVTGTPGGTQRRAIGNVVSRLDAVEITRRAPIATVQQLLLARTPGLTFHGSDGNVGSGRTIRIRGVSSLTLSQQPLIYVDGIRVDNDSQVGPTQVRASRASRLNDLNANDIESVEVIRGPAAATLYGTEASAGVIQIITKRGTTGAPRFEASIRHGANWLQNAAWKAGDAYAIDPDSGDLLVFNAVREATAAGQPVFTTGHLQAYNASIRGGTESVRYFLSADSEDITGMVDYNWNRRMSVRANVNVVPRPNLTVDLNTAYVDGTTSFMQATIYDVWYSVRMANPLTRHTRDRGFFRSPPEVSRVIRATRDYERFLASAITTHAPSQWFRHRLILGTDQTNDSNNFLIPRQHDPANHWFGGMAYGEKTITRPRTATTSLDYVAGVQFGANPRIGFLTSAGLQYYRYRNEAIHSAGVVFPSPAITSLAGAAEVLTTESFLENVSLGVFIQQELNLRDRIYLTAALRGDDNSAFGANYDAAIYPKLSATWVVTDEDFWPWEGLVNSLRLRTAWGRAGRQPTTFAAMTLYGPEVGPAGRPALMPRALGNDQLGPEVSTELEVGFDMALLGDRVSAEFTHYRQRVTDALIEAPVATSGGFPGLQTVNLGRLSNWGYEVRVDGRLVERPSFTFRLGGGFSHNMNRIDDLGGTPPTATLREGFRFPSVWYRTPILDSGRFNQRGQAVDVMCDGGIDVVDGYGWRGGPPVPCLEAPLLYWGPLGSSPNEATVDAMLTVGKSIALAATAEWRGFHRIEGNDPLCRFFCYPNDRYAVERKVPAIVACAVDSGGPCGGNASRTIHGANASFAKLREVSATYTFPNELAARFGASQASLTLAGRDLLTWQAQKCLPDDVPGFSPCYGGTVLADPETRDPSQSLGGGNANSGGVSALPGLSTFMATVRVSF